MTELKARFSNHAAFNGIVRADWVVAINADPDNWQARLYLPVEVTIAPEEAGGFEVPKFAEVDINQTTITYSDPIVVNVADVKQEMNRYFSESGEELLSYGDGNMSLRIGYDPVPVGAMVEWVEENADGGLSEVSWYVHSAQALGTQKAAVIYELISNGDTDQLVVSDDEQTPDAITEDDLLDLT